LRNGCFIESLVAVREWLARGEVVQRPQLLAFYADATTGTRGHTVLTFETDDELTVVDPQQGGATHHLPRRLSRDPLALARRLGGEHISRARFLPFTPPPSWSRLFAATPGAGGDGLVADARRPFGFR
jgi:hypothetical protein